MKKCCEVVYFEAISERNKFSNSKLRLNMFEHFFQCPYCWEDISMLLDTSIPNTNYIEDCEVCCRPIEVHASFDTLQNLERFSAVDIEQ